MTIKGNLSATISVMGLFVIATNTALFATPSITDVVAQQRYPWNGKVDISYTVSGNVVASVPQDMVDVLKVTATDILSNQTYVASSLSGDMALSDGIHNIVWDMGADNLGFVSTAVVFTVSCDTVPALYCIIDLSAGASASSYPVTYRVEPPDGGFNVNEYKTTKLVLRRIEPGTFQMCGRYQTTLTKPFYLGLFEVTQKQYHLVMGTNPSKYRGDKRPVERVSYNTIRGGDWPSSSIVATSSFMGKLQARTGLDFDLPTEAQWEFACRAGTTSSYNNGGSSQDDLKTIGRCSGNTGDGKGGYSDAHTTVGSYVPNSWGLYDMHGNVAEWCCDWYGDLSDRRTDPKGASYGSYRVMRGGSWYCNMSFCTSSYRSKGDPAFDEQDYCTAWGFRLSRTLDN